MERVSWQTRLAHISGLVGSILTHRSVARLQLEHQSLRMLDESVATLEKHMTTHTADVASTRKEMVALDQKLEEAVRGEQSARQAAFDACRRDIDLHLAGVEALELKAAEVIEAGSAGLSSMRETLQDTIAKEVQRRVAGDIEGLRRRTETLRSCVDEGLQLERDARLQAVDLLREETEQMVKAHAESSSSQRSVVPFDKLKLNIQSVLKQEGTVQLLERTNAGVRPITARPRLILRSVKQLPTDGRCVPSLIRLVGDVVGGTA